MILAATMLAAAAGADVPICTDRPAKANAVCTVPPGRWQAEVSALGWARAEAGGATTETLYAGASFLKFGVTERSDLQVGFTPFMRIRSKQDGATATASGSGDVTLRYKHRLSADDAPVEVALIPFAKLPTAKRGIGNGKAEGGIAVPLSLAAGRLTVTFGPEADLLADSDGAGRHLAIVNLVNVAMPVAPRVTFAGELWSNVNFDPAGTSEQVSADAALAYALSNDLQLDLGANVGLTRETPDIELTIGLSLRR